MTITKQNHKYQPTIKGYLINNTEWVPEHVGNLYIAKRQIENLIEEQSRAVINHFNHKYLTTFKSIDQFKFYADDPDYPYHAEAKVVSDWFRNTINYIRKEQQAIISNEKEFDYDSIVSNLPQISL